jgi:hypothetical protein
MSHILSGKMDTYYEKIKVEQPRPKYAKVNFFPEHGLPAILSTFSTFLALQGLNSPF